MSKRSYPSGSLKRQLNELKKKAAVANVPNLSTFGFVYQDDHHHQQEQQQPESEPSMPRDESTEKEKSVPASNTLSINNSNNQSPSNLSRNAAAESVINDDSENENQSDISHDPADWVISEDLINYFVEKGEIPQNINFDIKVDNILKSTGHMFGSKMRYLNTSLFKRTMINGEIVNRIWLVFSHETNKVYCGICKLFSKTEDQFSAGFNDWKNATQRVTSHENSSAHKESQILWVMREKKQDIASLLSSQYRDACMYWKQLLERIIDVILFLAERGLPLRGKDECFESANNGNYLGILQLLSKYDAFLAKHIEKYGNVGRGNVSYLSSTICNEIIDIVGKTILDKIINEVKEAKYFGLIVDSTPDLQHIDQLSFIIRYVDVNTFQAIERFLCFIPISSHTGENLTETILEFLHENGLHIENCRSQSYDNAANMSGKYSGVQTCIRQINPLAFYVPCSAHSLNLVGNCAANCCIDAISFFGIVQRIYTFLSSSTYRWKLFTDALKSVKSGRIIVAKSLSETRWSARDDAVKALKKNYAGVIKVLETLRDDNNQNVDTRTEAGSIVAKLYETEHIILCHFWADLLERINKVNKLLQTAGLDLQSVVDHLKSLTEYVCTIRNEFEHYENSCLDTIRLIQDNEDAALEYRHDKTGRARKRKRQFDESATPDHAFSPRDKFKTETYIVICDSLITELAKRGGAYDQVHKDFGFLLDVNCNIETKRRSAQKLVKKYKSDLENELENEIIHFHQHVQEVIKNKPVVNMIDTMKMILCNPIQCYPNISIAMRIYLTFPCSVCEPERSFSKLARIKNEKRATMGQVRLNSLSIISIELT